MKLTLVPVSFLLFLVLAGCGNDSDFTDDAGTFTDSRDRHKYTWIRIGEQIWMAENLAYLPSVHPPSQTSINSPLYYVYGYQGNSTRKGKYEDNYITYGTVYNWTAARTACPEGWHLPADEEWKTLEIQMGMSPSEADSSGAGLSRESGMVGYHLKSKQGWKWGNWFSGNGDDSIRFAARPGGGFFLNLGFAGERENAYFWTSSSFTKPGFTWYRSIYYGAEGVMRDGYPLSVGLSVRCIKN